MLTNRSVAVAETFGSWIQPRSLEDAHVSFLEQELLRMEVALHLR